MEIFLYMCVCVGGRQLCTAALLINKQVLFDFITLSRAFLGQLRIHNEYLCLSKWECGTQVARGKQPRGNNSCLQTHQLPKIAIRGVIGVVDGQQRERERGGTHSQPVVLPLILLTRSSFYATQPVAQVAPVPLYPAPLPTPTPLCLCRRQSVCHSGRFG